MVGSTLQVNASPAAQVYYASRHQCDCMWSPLRASDKYFVLEFHFNLNPMLTSFSEKKGVNFFLERNWNCIPLCQVHSLCTHIILTTIPLQ